MVIAETFDLDEIGKIDLSNIYDRTDPRIYYSTLRELDYIIPETAKPVFQQVIAAFRRARDTDKVRILDVGCSYGINAAMLKGDLEMASLYDHYSRDGVAPTQRTGLVQRDRLLIDDIIKDENLEMVGLDASANAIEYAVEAKLLDSGVAADLENGQQPSPRATAILGDVDMVISTGCIGYVGEDTLKGILEINAPNKPWMAHMVLRMFPFTPISEALSEFGYVTGKVEGQTFLQRRFACGEEQERVLERLSGLGIDPTGLESDGWYHAEAFISCPAEEHAKFGADVFA